MNLFTRYIRHWNRNRDLDDLIEHWDALEALVIRVYKGGAATAADEAEYQSLRSWMQANYAEWKANLRPHWRQAKVAGERAAQDPFLRLTMARSAEEFVDDWSGMQHLPAAREALNKFVLEMSEDE